MGKMNCDKIFRIKTSRKPKIGYNSLFLVRCKICGKLQLKWDTEMYNKVCPHCKNEGMIIYSTKEETKENIFRIQRRLYSEYKTNNILSTKEVELLSSFRETGFESTLKNLLSDYCFTTRNYRVARKVEWKISKRGEQLLKNQDFWDLLEECYKLIDLYDYKGGE